METCSINALGHTAVSNYPLQTEVKKASVWARLSSPVIFQFLGRKPLIFMKLHIYDVRARRFNGKDVLLEYLLFVVDNLDRTVQYCKGDYRLS